MPVEYATHPEYDFAETCFKWRGRTAVDLTWAAAARPWNEWTEIVLAGSGAWFPIKVAYPDFMRVWTLARKGSPE